MMGRRLTSKRGWFEAFGLAALVGCVVGGLIPIADAAASCPICGPNLIMNPGAEVGSGTSSDSVVKVPGWTRAKGSFTAASYAWSGGDLSATTPGPPNRGKNYFYGGPNPANGGGSVGEGTQTVSLSKAASAIATGKVTATLSGWLGGLSGQRDNAKLAVSFLAASGQALGSLTIGPVPAGGKPAATSALYLKSATGVVPKGTTSAQLSLILTRLDGSDNDGMADILSLTLAGP